MELRMIATFLRVAELQSFSRAAEQLGYSQSAVTVQIRQLEQELNTRLFERIGKQVKLTEEGSRLIPRAQDILKAVQSAKEIGLSPERPAGKLRLGTAESLLISVLPPIITEFASLCPHVELSTCTGPITDLFDKVRQNDIDILYFLDRKTNFPDWVKVMEHRESAVFVASASNPLASRKTLSMEELLREPFLLTEKGISYRYAMEQVLAADGIELHPFLETGNTDVITNMLRKGAGVSFLPRFVVKDYIERGQLAVLPAPFPEIEMWSQLIYHKNKWLTPQMNQFLRLMVKRLSR